ncbi:hypothetical protein DOY81_000882, partial [Sarcophaga bullata]
SVQGAQQATGGVRGVGQIRPSARGTQHAKPLQNLPGGWPWAWNHSAWPNRWAPWQHQSSGGPSSGGGGGGGGAQRGAPCSSKPKTKCNLQK